MAAFAWPLAAPLEPAQDSPVLEFTLTRVFGSESLVISDAALSPDGRWIVLTEGDQQQRSNLWVLSTGGGAPVPLTRGPYIDAFPSWFPSGERIAFVSTRPPVCTIMTVPFDPDSGTAAGPPRQVGLDVVGDSLDVSPDGKQIAYFSGKALKVIPATGGTARSLAGDGGYMPRWSPDGRSVHYLRGGSGRTRLMRVSVEGGRPEVVFTWPGWMSLVPGGANRSFVLREPQEGRGGEIATLGGLALGRLERGRPRGMNALGISKDGDQILAIRRDFAAPLTVLPVQGGPARRLAEGRAYEEPLGWSADGKEVLFESTLDGENLLFFAPLDGGPMRQVKLPETRRRDFSPVLSADGDHVLYARDEGEDGLSSLEVYSIEEDSSWELSRRHALLQAFVTGAGGSVYRDGPDFIFLEKRDDRYELYRSSPRGPSRLLRSFAREEPQSVAVHGNRIAYVVNSKTGGSLFLASAGDAPTRRLLTLNGELHQATWSPSGTSIAAYHFDPTAASGNDWRPEGRDLITLKVSPSGERVGDLGRRSVPGGHWWSLQWLPDGRGILAVGMDANVWLVPLDAEGRPVNLTQDDSNSAYNYRLSPDGRWIAYASGRQTGSSVWLLKLKEPLR